MSNQVDKAFVQQFSDNLISLAQRKGSLLRRTCMTKNVNAKAAHFDRLGATSAALKTGRHADTPLTDTPHSRRKVTMNDYVVADLIDEEDEIRMLIDPRSAYARHMGFALGRTLDDIILTAAEGAATTVSADDSTSTASVLAAHTIDEDFGAGDDNDITVEKIVEARRILADADVPGDLKRYFLVDPTAMAALLQETEIGSVDYNSVRALAKGDINTFCTFEFIEHTGLKSNAEGYKNCLFYTEEAIGLAMGRDITVRMTERPDKNYATQVHAAMTAGAVRVQEEHLGIAQAYRA